MFFIYFVPKWPLDLFLLPETPTYPISLMCYNQSKEQKIEENIADFESSSCVTHEKNLENIEVR